MDHDDSIRHRSQAIGEVAKPATLDSADDRH